MTAKIAGEILAVLGPRVAAFGAFLTARELWLVPWRRRSERRTEILIIPLVSLVGSFDRLGGLGCRGGQRSVPERQRCRPRLLGDARWVLGVRPGSAPWSSTSPGVVVAIIGCRYAVGGSAPGARWRCYPFSNGRFATAGDMEVTRVSAYFAPLSRGFDARRSTR